MSLIRLVLIIAGFFILFSCEYTSAEVYRVRSSNTECHNAAQPEINSGSEDEEDNKTLVDEEIEVLTRTVQSHIARYPEMEVQDLYKLIFQATHGPGHFIISEEKAWEWLQNEAEHLNPEHNYTREHFEPIGNYYVRANLIPLIQSDVKLESISGSFVNSCKNRVRIELFHEIWKVILLLSEDENWKGPASSEIGQFLKLAESRQWPAFHHSEKYKKLYNPHYRILSNSEAEELKKKYKLD